MQLIGPMIFGVFACIFVCLMLRTLIRFVLKLANVNLNEEDRERAQNSQFHSEMASSAVTRSSMHQVEHQPYQAPPPAYSSSSSITSITTTNLLSSSILQIQICETDIDTQLPPYSVI